MPPPPKADAPTAPAAAAAKPEKNAPAPESVASSAPAPAPSGGLRAWLPILVAVVVAPAATWATVQFVMLPRLEKKLANGTAAATAAAEAANAAEGKPAKPKEQSTYNFENVVVNLAGTMGTRYLKVGVVVMADQNSPVDLKKAFDENRIKLLDTTTTILSSLTLADLEEPGARNVIREKLVSAYNTVLKKKVAEQVYFSDFVVQ